MKKTLFVIAMFFASMFFIKAIAAILNIEFYNVVAGTALYMGIDNLVTRGE